MKKTCISRSSFLLFFCLISVCSFSEGIQDFIQSGSSIHSDTVIHSQGIGLEIFHTKSNRKYILSKNKIVRVYCPSENGHVSLQRAHIVEITDDHIVFIPARKHFYQVIYSPQTLHYMEFTTAESIVRGVFVNVVIISVRVIIAAFGVMKSISLGSSHHSISKSHTLIKFNDFHKHIRFYNLKGAPKWGIRILKAAP
jgi:hypothetical protein